MAELEDNALLLRLIPYSDSSLIIHCLTQQHGRISLLAKGARRIKSPFRASLLTMHMLQLRWKEPRTGSLGILIESRRKLELVPTYQSLSGQILIARAAKLFPDGVSQGYCELYKAFELLKHRAEDSGLCAATWCMFEAAGLVGDLEHCWHCAEILELEIPAFWLKGHLLCPACSNNHGMVVNLGLKKCMRAHILDSTCKLNLQQIKNWQHMIEEVQQFHKH